MALSPVFYSRQYDWEPTSTDYHVYTSTTEGMPNRLPDVSRYPNVRNIVNRRNNRKEEPEMIHQLENNQKQHHRHSPKHGKMVHMADQVQVIPQESPQVVVEENIDFETDGFLQQKQITYQEKPNVVVAENVDMETDGFLQQKHKGFELSKWKTFKMN